MVGLTQGLITSILLLTTRDKQLSQRILGVTVLVFCIANCRVLLHSSGLWHSVGFKYFPVGMELFLPPLIYLYVLSLTETNFVVRKKHLWYFAPAFFYGFYDIILYLLVVGYDSIPAKDQVASQLYFNQLNVLEDYLIVILTIASVIFSYKKIMAYLFWLKQFKQHQTFPIYGWLRSIISWGVVLCFLLMANQLLDTFSITKDFGVNRWRFFNLFLAFVTYYLGFMGYKKDGLKIHESKINLETLSKKLSQGHIQEVEKMLLEKLDKEAVYLDASITMKQLATELNVTYENLSLVVNQKFDMGFRDLINSYRVNRVKKLLCENKNNQFSILELALDSGFNSQASFYRAFKKFEGMSPKDYMAKFS